MARLIASQESQACRTEAEYAFSLRKRCSRGSRSPHPSAALPLGARARLTLLLLVLASYRIIPIMMEEEYRPNGWLGALLGTKLFFEMVGGWTCVCLK